jgi:riboflavin synthase
VFTGIVEAACQVFRIEQGTAATEGRVRLALDLAPLRQGLDPERPETSPLVGLGDSVAVNGACLTVASLEGDRASFDVVPETLRCTNLGSLKQGQRANVERALRFGDRVDGHLVQGHVESTGTLDSAEEAGGELRLRVSCGADFARRCLPKGSLALNGVSLTLAELHRDAFVVALVPHTLERTTLGGLAPGEQLNLEPDMIGQWVLRAVASQT